MSCFKVAYAATMVPCTALSNPLISLLEKTGGQEAGWEEKEADPEIHSGLHSSCGGWHHGCCQLRE